MSRGKGKKRGIMAHPSMFQRLDLRDHAQEQAFLSQLRAAGVPVATQTFAVNIPRRNGKSTLYGNW